MVFVRSGIGIEQGGAEQRHEEKAKNLICNKKRMTEKRFFSSLPQQDTQKIVMLC